MSGEWIVCKNALPHNPHTDVCLMVVMVPEDRQKEAKFNVWLLDNGLYAYRSRSYRQYFEKRQKLPEPIAFKKTLEVTK